jgi:transposase
VSDERTGELFFYVDIEERVPKNHPLRLIRRIVNEVLAALDGEFAKLYAEDGRPSIAPERLLRALLLQAFYTIRSERQLMEQLQYNLLYRWFVGLGVDDPVWVPTVFTKNRDRLLGAVRPHESAEGSSLEGTQCRRSQNSEFAAQIMLTNAGFHADQTRGHVGKPSFQPQFGDLLASITDVFCSDAHAQSHHACRPRFLRNNRLRPSLQMTGSLRADRRWRLAFAWDALLVPASCHLSGRYATRSWDSVLSLRSQEQTLVLEVSSFRLFIKGLRHRIEVKTPCRNEGR